MYMNWKIAKTFFKYLFVPGAISLKINSQNQFVIYQKLIQAISYFKQIAYKKYENQSSSIFGNIH